MKTITKADTEAPQTTFRGSHYSKPIEVPDGEIHLLEKGEVYEIEGPARIDYRSGKSWCRTLLAPETKALHGPLIFSSVTPISEAQWVHEARAYANLDFVSSVFLLLVVLSVPLSLLGVAAGLLQSTCSLLLFLVIWWIACGLGLTWFCRRRYSLAINDVTDIKVPFSPIRS